MSWRSRNLHLLYVNDDPGSAGDDESAFAARAAHFVHVEPIDNLHSATEALLHDRAGALQQGQGLFVAPHFM